jgi:hypothetical protein
VGAVLQDFRDGRRGAFMDLGSALSPALGLTADDAEEVREAILSAALSGEADPAQEDEFGKRYVLDFEMKTSAGTATVRSGWIVRRGEVVPRFTTCFVL